jgi:hypothetical protein
MAQVIVGSPHDWNFVHHAGGVARLLETRDPPKQKTGFDMHIARHLQRVVAITNPDICGLQLTSGRFLDL